MKVFFYKKGAPTGRVRINLHTSENNSEIFTSSEWIDLADIPDDFLGEVRFDFTKKLRKAQTYRLTAEGDSYVHDGDNDYLAFLHDSPGAVYPKPVEDRTHPLQFPVKFAVYAEV